VTTFKFVCERERERNAVRCNMMRCHSRRRVYMQYAVLAGIECVQPQCYALHCVLSSTQTWDTHYQFSIITLLSKQNEIKIHEGQVVGDVATDSVCSVY